MEFFDSTDSVNVLLSRHDAFVEIPVVDSHLVDQDLSRSSRSAACAVGEHAMSRGNECFSLGILILFAIFHLPCSTLRLPQEALYNAPVAGFSSLPERF